VKDLKICILIGLLYNVGILMFNYKKMTTISVEVSDEIAKRFVWVKVVKYEDILEYEDNLKYSFSDEKVSLNELSSFLWNVISDKEWAC